MDLSVSARKPCFIEEEDDGLASLAEMEAGVSGNSQNGVVSSPFCYTRRNSFRSMNYYPYYHHFSLSSPRSGVSGRFGDFRFEHQSFAHHHHNQPHFLDSCFLCKKPLGDNRDIYMYRGDTPFCSVDCRQEQMERDEAKEKKQSLSSSMKAMRRKEQRDSSVSPTRSPDYTFHAGTVAAA